MDTIVNKIQELFLNKTRNIIIDKQPPVFLVQINVLAMELEQYHY
jgi:hypothetical protein